MIVADDVITEPIAIEDGSIRVPEVVSQGWWKIGKRIGASSRL